MEEKRHTNVPDFGNTVTSEVINAFNTSAYFFASRSMNSSKTIQLMQNKPFLKTNLHEGEQRRNVFLIHNILFELTHKNLEMFVWTGLKFILNSNSFSWERIRIIHGKKVRSAR